MDSSLLNRWDMHPCLPLSSPKARVRSARWPVAAVRRPVSAVSFARHTRNAWKAYSAMRISRTLTPLIYSKVNLYGTFHLDPRERLEMEKVGYALLLSRYAESIQSCR